MLLPHQVLGCQVRQKHPQNVSRKKSVVSTRFSGEETTPSNTCQEDSALCSNGQVPECHRHQFKFNGLQVTRSAFSLYCVKKPPASTLEPHTEVGTEPKAEADRSEEGERRQSQNTRRPNIRYTVPCFSLVLFLIIISVGAEAPPVSSKERKKLGSCNSLGPVDTLPESRRAESICFVFF